ncbi:MAG: iron-containing alcohol dehydrogenase [Candidatus Odinarchaeota archaeon]
MIPSFNFTSIPHIIFGPGAINQLFDIITKFGKTVLYVIGENSLKKSGKWSEIVKKSEDNSINYYNISVSGEPSPTLIDTVVNQFRDKKPDLVVGIGGGSVTDAGKAISAMMLKKDSIKNYLEGVGTKIHDGTKIPYIAIPTTSGTGSEATKNAVISEIGPDGFKKSLRHDNLIPNYAIIDPELIISCPSSVTAVCGMDAFTQLLEAYTSNKSNPLTDSLAYSGMKYMKDAIIPACTTRPSDVNIRSSMAYGSLISGICLANAGLGIIHGLASPIGGFFEIPHGVVCGTLLAESTKMNIEKLKELGSSGKQALQKYAYVGALFDINKSFDTTKIDFYCSLLIEVLEGWTSDLKIDLLGKYGIKEGDIEKIVNNTGLKNNPVPLTKEDIKKIVGNRI